ncbi:MAG: 16S rRNA (guanine(966)-N(2))-methyltransferase RsmD [Armatimonadetes bacterium]|nr:16S rRNA (guanine(966)-N(2))-methyltransferase RsmD [Armatimonadota bacterium]
MAGVQRIRIIGGSARGRTIHTQSTDRVRPTPAALREALANILRGRLAGARVLDLCAGFGTVGLELLSQGAAAAVFIEKDARTADVIRRNLTELDFDDRAEVWTNPAESGVGRLATEGREFEWIFVDPPYDIGLATKLLERLARYPQVIAEGGQVIVQHSRREALPETEGPLKRYRERQTGDTLLSFYEVTTP